MFPLLAGLRLPLLVGPCLPCLSVYARPCSPVRARPARWSTPPELVDLAGPRREGGLNLAKWRKRKGAEWWRREAEQRPAGVQVGAEGERETFLRWGSAKRQRYVPSAGGRGKAVALCSVGNLGVYPFTVCDLYYGIGLMFRLSLLETVLDKSSIIKRIMSFNIKINLGQYEYMYQVKYLMNLNV